MSLVRFSELHERKLEVQIPINDLVQRFRGIGSYEADEKLGNILRIDVDDDAGGFSLLLQEGESKCSVQPVLDADLDYRLYL